ncbi:OppA family ABC transporter substrate-binding lipoprotein [Mycoplasma corogypsi]|uniref:OppA family ABC transporter substrate-binding lipoprotein n=1 Tax=Mycoplasma corogypsi TaxID=2106 RepID=UPI003873BAB8
MKFKRLLLSFTSASAITMPLVAISCGDPVANKKEAESNSEFAVSYQSAANETHPYNGTLSNLTKSAKSNLFVSYLNTDYTPTDSPVDYSSAYGNKDAGQPTVNLTVPSLLSYEFVGRPVVETKETVDQLTGKTESHSVIVKPSLYRRKFEHADAIVLHFADGTSKTYDTDEATVVSLQPTANGWDTQSVQLISENPKSINSRQFENDLRMATKLEARVRDGLTWTMPDGTKTNYKVTALDYWMGFVRTRLNDYAYRVSAAESGNKSKAKVDALNAATNQILTSTSKTYTHGSTYPNAYLYGLYGIDFESISNKEKAVREEGGRSYLVINGLAGEKSDFSDIINKFIGDYDFTPAPYEYLKDVAEHPEKLKVTSASTAEGVATKIQELATLVKDLPQNSLLRLSGYFWYGNTRETTLFSGKYLPNAYNSQSRSVDYVVNKNYWDQAYVNHPRRIRTFSIKYGKVDTALFNTQSLNRYIGGDQSSVSYSDLSATDKTIVTNAPQDYGLTFTRARTRQSLLTNVLNQFIPNYPNQGNNTELIDEPLSRLLYGVPLADLKNKQHASVLEYATTGVAREFRSIIFASLNWAAISTALRGGEPTNTYLSGLTPDSNINEDTADTSLSGEKALSPRANWKELSTLFVVDKTTNQRVELKDGERSLGTEIDPTETNSVQSSADTRFRSAAFAQLQARMKKLLDEFYAANPGIPSEIKYKFVYRYTNPDDSEKQTLTSLFNTLGKLDPRLKFEFIMPKDATEWRANWLSLNHSFLYNWGYDYNGIGSGFDGYSWNGYLLPIMSRIATNAEYAEKMKAFPQLTKAAQALKTYVDKMNAAGTHKLSIPYDKWSELENNDLAHLSQNLGSMKLSGQGNKLVELSAEEKDKQLDGYSFSARFWLDLQNNKIEGHKFSKKDLIELGTELTNLYGFTTNVTFGLSADPFIRTIVNPSYIVPSFGDKPADLSAYLVAFNPAK